MIANQRLRILRERVECRLLGLDLRFERQHILQLRATVLADISKRQVADVHAVHVMWSSSDAD